MDSVSIVIKNDFAEAMAVKTCLFVIDSLPQCCTLIKQPGQMLAVQVSAGSPGGLAWSLYKCVVLWRAVYGPYATERAF